MGILDVYLTNIVGQLDGKTYSLYGENFTQNSRVYVNEERQKVKFLNNTRIELKDMTLEEGDVITVSQVGSSNRIFRTSEEYVYSQGGLVKASEYIPPVPETVQEETLQTKE